MKMFTLAYKSLLSRPLPFSPTLPIIGGRTPSYAPGTPRDYETHHTPYGETPGGDLADTPGLVGTV